MYKWDEMTPRERDELVWTEVMDGKKPRLPYISVNFPKYSTDISATWEVVEKLISDGWEPHINYDVNRTGIWEVCFGHNVFDAQYHIGKSVHEVICIAALKAVGVDIE